MCINGLANFKDPTQKQQKKDVQLFPALEFKARFFGPQTMALPARPC
jgi:hypothetical protein